MTDPSADDVEPTSVTDGPLVRLRLARRAVLRFPAAGETHVDIGF